MAELPPAAYYADLWPRRRFQSRYSIVPASQNPPRLFENCSKGLPVQPADARAVDDLSEVCWEFDWYLRRIATIVFREVGAHTMARSSGSSDRPEDFSEFQGPANWFRCRYPDSVRLAQKESVIEIRPKAAGTPVNWSMALYTAWVDPESTVEPAPTFSVSTLFPAVRKSCQGKTLQIDTANRSWFGSSRRRGSENWWQRLRRRSYEWRPWILEHENVMVVVSLQSVPGTALEAETIEMCESILESIRFAPVPAMPPEPFRQEVMQLARKHFPLLDVQPKGRFALELQGSEINLSNFYRSYLQQPEKLAQVILPGLTSVVRLQEWGPDQVMPPFEEVEDRIMPMLYPDEDAAETLKDFVQLPWIGGLTQVFVIDEDDTYRFVHGTMLQQWDMSMESLQELAMDNLEGYAADHPMQVNLIGNESDPQMLVPVNPDPYNSARILGHTFHQRLRELFGPEVIVGVPNRDFFVAVSLNHPKLVNHVRDRVAQDYHSMHHPLTQRLLVISGDGVSEYCETE